MLIINQDRDQVIVFEFTDRNNLFTEPVIYNNVLIGFNLLLKGILLGTFDNLETAITEINNILFCENQSYAISGHEDWEDWEAVKQLMLDEELISYIDLSESEG